METKNSSIQLQRAHTHTQSAIQINYHSLWFCTIQTLFSPGSKYSILLLGPEVFIQHVQSLGFFSIILQHTTETSEMQCMGGEKKIRHCISPSKTSLKSFSELPPACSPRPFTPSSTHTRIHSMLKRVLKRGGRSCMCALYFLPLIDCSVHR